MAMIGITDAAIPIIARDYRFGSALRTAKTVFL
jgi:hypothetical protein